MMPGEDLSGFFNPDEGAVRCSNAGHPFYAWFNEPQGTQGFEQMDIQVTDATLTMTTEDAVKAQLQQGGEVAVEVPTLVDGEAVIEPRVYSVRLPRRGGDGAFTHVQLGSRKT